MLRAVISWKIARYISGGGIVTTCELSLQVDGQALIHIVFEAGSDRIILCETLILEGAFRLISANDAEEGFILFLIRSMESGVFTSATTRLEIQNYHRLIANLTTESIIRFLGYIVVGTAESDTTPTTEYSTNRPFDEFDPVEDGERSSER